MVTGERLKVTLRGGAPWGFRLQGGGHFPLEVAKIRKKSQAFSADLREGDVILAINGYSMSGKTHQSAMDIIEMSSHELVFDVVRPASRGGPMKVADPQRQLRSVPASGHSGPSGPGGHGGPGGPGVSGLVSSARKNFTSQDGNTHREVQTNQFVVEYPAGKKVTKTVTEQRTFTTMNNELSPSTSQTTISSGGHKSRSPNRSPLIWQPPSISPSVSQSSSLQIDTQKSSSSWQQSGLLSPRSPSDSQSRSPLMWQPKSASPSPSGRQGSHGRSGSSLSNRSYGKENEDPSMMAEQARWEARKGPENVPKFKLDNFGSARVNSSPKYATFPRTKDPNYPMFDVPRTDWSPQRPVPDIPEPELYPVPQVTRLHEIEQGQPHIVRQQTPKQEPPRGYKKPGPPVPPKPSSPVPPAMYFDPEEQPVAGVDRHRPGMIRPPAQPNVVTAPPPPAPPMPPAPIPTINVPQFQPTHASTPKQNGYDEVDAHKSRPDHLPVFAPKCYFAPDDDSGLYSPDRADTYSEVSSLTKKEEKGPSPDSENEKLFSDSAFYDDHTNRYPTIDEQMSMCKKIADSLTSAANKRARGARMFMRRKGKANKWIHDERAGLIFVPDGSEYSSSAGDVAHLDDLDSELYWDEGGSKPLFSFRIPKIAGQISQGQKMSLTKEEFERLRFAAPRVDHQAVSPNVCFSIAADLHKGGRNKGAKLFARRQARVEKFVIDDSNVHYTPKSPTRLEQITHQQPVRTQPTPWEAAATGNMAAFDPRAPQMNFQPASAPSPKHSLVGEKPKVLGGKNYNTLARGWQGSGPGHQQHSYYRGVNPDTIPDSGQQEQPEQPEQTEGDAEGDGQQPAPVNYQDQQQQPQQYYDNDDVDGSQKFGDYNRRIKAWPGSGAGPTSSRTVQSYSEQSNYNSLPRGFGMQPKHEMSVSTGYCDL